MAVNRTDRPRMAFPLNLLHQLGDRWPLGAPVHDGWRISIGYGLAAIALGVLLGTYAVGITYAPATWGALFTVGLLTVFAAMIVGNVRRILLAVVVLDIPLQLDIYLSFREDVAALGSIGGLPISVTTFALCGLYALWLSEWLAQRRPSQPKWLSMSFPLALYVFFAGLSIIAASDKLLASFELALLVQLFLMHVYILGTVTTREDVLYIVVLLLVGLLLESVIIGALRVLGSSVKIAGITARVSNSRVSGTVGSPNNAGAFLVLSLGPAMGLMLSNARMAYRWLATAAFGAGSVALIFTLSRGGWLAFAISMGLLCFFAVRRGWMSGRVIVVVLVVAFVLILPLRGVVVERLTADDGGAAESRIPLMELALRIIRDHPILGVGINNGPIILPNYITPDLGKVWVYAVHNKYLAIWSEIGTGGVLAYLLFLWVTLRRGWRCFRTDDRLLAPLALGYTVAVFGHMIHMLFDTFRSRPNVQLLWLSAALMAVLQMMSARDDPRDGSVQAPPDRR